MKIESALKPKEYLDAMKERMEGHFDLGNERFTGFFLGRAFTVTHHAGAEWNRRITNEKNTAVGFVKKTDMGCSVSFVRCRGILSPPLFLTTFAILFIPLLLTLMIGTVTQEISPMDILNVGGVCFGITLFLGLATALCESLTEAGQEGRKILNALLLDPTDIFSYTHNQNLLDF